MCSAACFYYPFTLFMRSNFFFINRIFKNDLISDCLCALNHVVGPVHKREGGPGWGEGRPAGRGQRPPAPPGLREDEGGRGGGRGGPPANGATGRRCQEGCCPLAGTPRAVASPLGPWMKTRSYIIRTFGAEVKPGPHAKLNGIN